VRLVVVPSLKFNGSHVHMNENRENKFVAAVAEIAHSQMGYLIGFGLMMLAIYVGVKWDGHLYDRKGCVQLQEISGQIYKVDTCSGDNELISIDAKKEP